MLKVVFFAALREQLSCDKLTLTDLDGVTNIAELKTQLCQKNPNWQSALLDNTVLSAINHTMVADDHPINNGDEVAFFPPVTGG